MSWIPSAAVATRRSAPLRAGLWAMAAVSAVIGVYGFVDPRGFYANVVGVDLLGPYNQHLLTDVGGFYLGFAVVFAWAARTLSVELIRGVSLGFAVAQTLHFVYHLTQLDGFSVGEAIAQTILLAAILAAPVVFFVLATRLSNDQPDAVRA